MVNPTDHERILPAFGEVALQAQAGARHLEHFRIHAAMRLMTSRTAFPHGLVLENEGSGLGGMTFSTGSRFSRMNTLGQKGRVGLPVGVMAVNAGHPVSGRHWMAVRKGKLSLNIDVALDAGFRRAARVVDQVPPLPFHGMEAPWAMTGFTSQLNSGLLINHQPGMRGIVKIPSEVLMAKHAILGPHILGPHCLRDRENGPVD